MTSVGCAILAAVSIFDYPELQPRHEALKARMVAAIRDCDMFAMRKACLEATEVFPEDPVWNYNLACAYSKGGKTEKALKALEKAIRYGYRDSRAISQDPDLKPISDMEEFHKLLDKADELRNVPVAFGPLSATPAKGKAGEVLIVDEHNLAWDFDKACFAAKMELEGDGFKGNEGDLYFNRDRGHSNLPIKEFPGLTPVSMGSAAKEKGVDLDFPNVSFPYPVFGNCSRALVAGPMWRSLPRALVTSQAFRLKAMSHFYLSNQIWVFPVVNDCPPLGKYGDVFASQTPYWIATQGRSWSDQYYLKAALEVSRTLKPEVKKEIVSRGHLAPTVQAIIRRSLKSVTNETDYLTSQAHPTAFPANGLDMARLKNLASSLAADSIPPVVQIKGVAVGQTKNREEISGLPELSYVSPCAWAFVLRKSDESRVFIIGATGADEYSFAEVHGQKGAAKIEKLGADVARITIDKTLITQSNRVDIAIFGRSKKSDWGAPAFVSFAVLDPASPYCDPVLLGSGNPADSKK